MKNILPFIFPVTALLVVSFLAFRWYGQRTDRVGDIGQFGEGVEIEELSESERNDVLQGTGDFKTVDLEAPEGVAEEGEAMEDEAMDAMEKSVAMGQIRYELADGKVRFSVSATLPELEAGNYQVWLKAVDSEAIRKAFRLVYAKGGYTGSAAISDETLPFEVVVTQEAQDDNTPEETLLRGVIESE